MILKVLVDRSQTTAAERKQKHAGNVGKAGS